MKITILVGGKFHAFNLAEQINKKNFLKLLITSYPKFSLKKYGIKKDKIYSIYLKEVLIKIFNKFEVFRNFFDYNYHLSNYFDNKASKVIDFSDTDLLIGWSGFSKFSFLKAKKFKCIKILERGSSHIKFQKEILKDEYLKLGIKPNIPSDKMIDKEIEEYDLADYIFVPSQFVKDTFLKYGFSDKKIVKIPYGVDLKEFQIIENSKLEDDKFRIISTGTLSVRKGSHYLIQAFLELSLDNSELIFVGPIDLEMKEYLKKYKKYINIKFINKQKQERLKFFYNKSNLFVQCSIEEGLSMVQAQAMACGLPVICTTNTGGAEIIDEGFNGHVIPIRNIQILKNKIKDLYYDRVKLNKMSKNAYEKAKNELSWELYGNKILETYKTLIKNNFIND